ncbi:MAG: DNA double-strand break repair nuclease NurA [Euryarchaeota archaeon]|nr:DNA double-strand break repair nuclease NurA [Euryarchaeota archaeon]
MKIDRDFDIDTLHPQIYQFVVEEIPNSIKTFIDFVEDRRKNLKNVSKKVKPIDVVRYDMKKIAKYKITGADGGDNGKELEGFYFGIVGAIAYTSQGLEEEDKTPISFGKSLIWDDEVDPGRRAAAIRDRFMYDVATKAIEKRKPDFLLIDGPLIPNSRYIPSREDSKEYNKDYNEMKTALFSLLNLAQKEYKRRGMLFACVVKRVRSTYYSDILGLSKSIRDSVLLNPVLKKGQRTDLIDPAEGRMLKDEFPKEHKEIKLFFIKSTEGMSPIRVEIPGWLSKEVDEISSLIHSTADPLTGIPFHILRADILTKVNIPTTDLTYTRFISHAMDKVKSGELSEKDLDMINLRRLEIWRL